MRWDGRVSWRHGGPSGPKDDCGEGAPWHDLSRGAGGRGCRKEYALRRWLIWHGDRRRISDLAPKFPISRRPSTPTFALVDTRLALLEMWKHRWGLAQNKRILSIKVTEQWKHWLGATKKKKKKGPLLPAAPSSPASRAKVEICFDNSHFSEQNLAFRITTDDSRFTCIYVSIESPVETPEPC